MQELYFLCPQRKKKIQNIFYHNFIQNPLDNTIVDLAGRVFRNWNASHGLDINDAILESTSMQTGGRIYSLNVKHFSMPELNVIKSWK